jgi:hypothetical protein
MWTLSYGEHEDVPKVIYGLAISSMIANHAFDRAQREREKRVATLQRRSYRLGTNEFAESHHRCSIKKEIDELYLNSPYYIVPDGEGGAFKLVTPVRLPPGRFRLGTSPMSAGSVPTWKTIGIFLVAAFAASDSGVPVATIRAT